MREHHYQTQISQIIAGSLIESEYLGSCCLSHRENQRVLRLIMAFAHP
jgi:hypothetical protein